MLDPSPSSAPDLAERPERSLNRTKINFAPTRVQALLPRESRFTIASYVDSGFKGKKPEDRARLCDVLTKVGLRLHTASDTGRLA
jgi:hypothetical protein